MKKLITLLMVMGMAIFAMPLMAETETPSNGDEQLKMATAEAVKTITDFANNATNFTKEQAPDVAKQYLMWYSFSSMEWMIIHLIIFSVFIITGTYLILLQKSDCLGNSIGPGVFLIVIATLFSLCAFDQYLDYRKAKIAPKIILLNYAKSLTK